jgi:hypothetical protein
MWHFADLWFAYSIFLYFADLKLPQVRKYILFVLTNKAYKAPNKIWKFVHFKKVFKSTVQRDVGSFELSLKSEARRFSEKSLRPPYCETL